jgi:UbiD family decarboxylase
MVKNPHGGHPLVAQAEFALTGIVPPHVRRPEGPFGDHYGYNSLQHDYPIFQVQQMYHRRNAVYPATVVGRPRQEDFFIGDFLLAKQVSTVLPQPGSWTAIPVKPLQQD